MKIDSIRIVNFKGIEDMFIKDIGGKNIYLMGPNEAGKTSFIDAVWCALSGKNMPSEPIHKGAVKGLVELDLSDFIVRLKLKKNKPFSLEIERKVFENEIDRIVKSPRTFLNECIGTIDFDINKFFEKTGAEQVKYLCDVIGVDFNHLNADLDELLEGRKVDDRQLKAKKQTFNYYDKELAKAEPVDVVILSNQIIADEAKVSAWDRVKAGMSERAKRKEQLEAELLKVNNEITGGEEWLANPDNAAPKPEDVQAAKKRLDESNTTNSNIAEAKAMATLETEIEALQTRYDAATTSIEDIRREKAKLLKTALKVDGLEYDVAEERFLYNGLPFERNQINTASQIVAGLKIASTLLKDLKILKFDASLIDKKNMAEIREFASTAGIELFVELVNRESDKLEVIVD